MLAIAHPSVLPSAMLNGVGTPVAIISQLNVLPACAPVNASMAASRLAMHDSGAGWLATPSLYDSCIHYSTPVYPGALSNLLSQLLPPGLRGRLKTKNVQHVHLLGKFMRRSKSWKRGSERKLSQ
jgi:hypothetical protein